MLTGRYRPSDRTAVVSRHRRALLEARSVRACLIIFLISTLAACAGIGRKAEPPVIGAAGSAEGQWRGRALIRDLEAKKSSELLLEIVAREPNQLRMEVVTSGLGVYLASIAMNGSSVEAIIARERRFVRSASGEDAFRSLVPVRISPVSLMSLLFSRPLDPDEWRCRSEAVGGMERCVREGGGIVVTIGAPEASSGRRRFGIVSGGAEIELLIEAAPSKVEIKDELFSLAAPSGYSVEAL